MERRNIQFEEQNPLETIIELNYINRNVPEIESEIELNAGNIKGIHKFYLLQIHKEMESYLVQKLETYGISNEDSFDELARLLVFAGKSLICQSTFNYILKEAKLEGVSPQRYIDDVFAIGEPQGIISSLTPYEKQVISA